MKIYKIMCFFLLGMALCSSAKAAELNYNRVSGEVTVGGNNLSFGKIARMIVLKPDADYEKLQNGQSSFFESCIHIAEVTQSDNDENYSFPKFTVSTDAPAGEYKVIVAVDNKTPETIILDYASVNQCLEFIEKAENSSQVEKYIEKYNDDVYGLSIDKDSDFDKIDENGKVTVLGGLIGTKYDSPSSLQLKFNAEVEKYIADYRKMAFKAISNLKTAKEVEETIGLYNNIYGIDLENELFTAMDSESKQSVYKKMTEEVYTEESNISLAFEQKVVLRCIESGAWGNIPQYINKYNDSVLHLNLKKYDSKNTAQLKFILTKNLKNVSDLQNAIDTYTKSTTGGGGGGGTGSGSKRSDIGSSGAVNWTGQNTVTQQETAPFKDVSANHWAYTCIKNLYDNGIINGKSEGIFAPDDNVTRAEAVKMIISLADGLDAENADTEFSDISDDSWEYSYVMKASALGIAEGYDDGSFGKGDYITRQDLCVMIYRLMLKYNLQLKSDTYGFEDDFEIADYAKKAIESMFAEGIISGNENGRFLPRNFATRAETAKIIYSAMNLIK